MGSLMPAVAGAYRGIGLAASHWTLDTRLWIGVTKFQVDHNVSQGKI
jgi:hypothetical protein